MQQFWAYVRHMQKQARIAYGVGFHEALFCILSILCKDLFHDSTFKMATPIDNTFSITGSNGYG